jgi:UDP:flavonoid glycosyltransferase YjiC (YdhE family)
VLELGRVLSQRGHRIEFATHKGQEKWVATDYYGFISRVHTMGDAMDPEDEAAYYLDMQKSDPRKCYLDYFRPRFAVDAFWPSDFAHLRDIVASSRPDMIVADFLVDAVRDIQYLTGIPAAMVWPQMPYGMVGARHIPGVPGFQIDALSGEHASVWTRLRAELRPLRAITAIVPYLRHVWGMRRAEGVDYLLPVTGKPDYLALVNSFWGLETPKDLPPLLNAVGPILADEYPPLDDPLEAFFASHHRVVYVSFGTHIQVQPDHLDRFLSAFGGLFREGLIDGVVWAANDAQQRLFLSEHVVDMGTRTVRVCDLVGNRDSAWYFTPFAPQRAILDRPETVIFVTHGGGSSLNEAMFHGKRLLGLGFFFDQPLNCLRIREAGVGLALDKVGFTADEIVDKCRRMLLDEDGCFAQDVQRMKHIARASSRKKYYAADLIQEVMYDYKFSLHPPGNSLHNECAVTGRGRRRPMHLQTADVRMPLWRARNWDLRAIGTFTMVGVVGIGCYAYIHLVKGGVGLRVGWGRALLLKMILPRPVVAYIR